MKIIFVVLTNILLFACVNNNRTDAPELLDKILDKQILIKNNRVRLIVAHQQRQIVGVIQKRNRQLI